VLTGLAVSRHVSSGDNLTDMGRAAVIQQIDAIQADIIVQSRNGPGEYTWHAQDWLNREYEYEYEYGSGRCRSRS
jgi:hypothetical protein